MYSGIIFAVFLVVAFAWQVYAVVNCTATGNGRFGDPADTTCKNYTYCVYVPANNTYLAYDYTCPTTSLFSPLSRLCTTNYTCAS